MFINEPELDILPYHLFLFTKNHLYVLYLLPHKYLNQKRVKNYKWIYICNVITKYSLIPNFTDNDKIDIIEIQKN